MGTLESKTASHTGGAPDNEGAAFVPSDVLVLATETSAYQNGDTICRALRYRALPELRKA